MFKLCHRKYRLIQELFGLFLQFFPNLRYIFLFLVFIHVLTFFHIPVLIEVGSLISVFLFSIP